MNHDRRFEPAEVREDAVLDEDLIDHRTGKRGLHNHFYEDARAAQIKRFRARFPSYRAPDDGPFTKGTI